MDLREFFENNQNRNMIDKWLHYFEIYERHFRPFVDKKKRERPTAKTMGIRTI